MRSRKEKTEYRLYSLLRFVGNTAASNVYSDICYSRHSLKRLRSKTFRLHFDSDTPHLQRTDKVYSVHAIRNELKIFMHWIDTAPRTTPILGFTFENPRTLYSQQVDITLLKNSTDVKRYFAIWFVSIRFPRLKSLSTLKISTHEYSIRKYEQPLRYRYDASLLANNGTLIQIYYVKINLVGARLSVHRVLFA